MTDPRHTTLDPHLAGFLVYSGAKLLGFRRLSPKRVAYQFAANQDLHMLLRHYWHGQPLLIRPGKLFAEFHRLKCLAINR